MIYVGILWLVCSLPIVTAGASATAAYYAMSKSVRSKTGYIGKEFFRSFKMNFLQSLPLTIIYGIVFAVLALDVIYVWNNDSRVNSAIFMVLCLVGFIYAGVLIYSAPLLSRFVTNNLNLFKMAFIITFKYLPLTILILAAGAAAAFAVYLMPWMVFVVPGVYMYGLTFPMEWMLKKLMPSAGDEDSEDRKWYYQN